MPDQTFEQLAKSLSDTTQGLGGSLPGATSGWLGPVLAAAIIVALLFLAYWWLARTIGALERKGRLSKLTVALLRRIAFWTACLFGALLVLQQFGLLDNAWAALTAILAMVAIGFVAVWSVLSNSLCSVLLMITKPFNVGDEVELPADNLRGKVIDFNLIFTTLRDTDGSLVQVPNNTFLQKPIRCRTGGGTVTLDQQADRERPTE